MSQEDEWISAAEALALVDMPFEGQETICTHAHAGMVKARAKKYISDKRTFTGDDLYPYVDLPAEFWWTEGKAALIAIWDTGYFETWTHNNLVRHQAFGVQFRRSDIEALKPAKVAMKKSLLRPVPAQAEKKIFIGHGHSSEWLKLKEFLKDELKLEVVEFNTVSAAGISTPARLRDMLDKSVFAFLIMTAEDEQADGSFNPRMNVVHEAGLFQGKLGFEKAIILLEEGCAEFSNAYGLNHIPFQKRNIKAAFEDVRGVLKRENLLIPATAPPQDAPTQRFSDLGAAANNLEREPIVSDRHAFYEALEAVMSHLLKETGEAREIFLSAGATDKAVKSPQALEARRHLSRGALHELRPACLRYGGKLTADFLELDRKIEEFASRVEQRRSTYDGGWTDAYGLHDGFEDQLAAIEAKSKHLHKEAAARIQRANRTDR
jgi:predicted nucleotide-binding protein